jgi:hypothetical protein
MRRLMMIVAALGAALLVSSAALAQVPPDPNNPNEKIQTIQTKKCLISSARRPTERL